MNDPQTLINIIMGISVPAWLFIGRELWTAVTKLREDLAQLKTQIAETYVPKEDYRQDMADIKAGIQKIFDKMDLKVDK